MKLEIDGWSSKITFSATHLIPGHFKCGRLHGHDYAINARIEGEVGRDGVIMDFISVKDFLRGIASELDHRVLVPAKDPGVRVSEIGVEYLSDGKEYRFPREDCALLDLEVASAEGLAEFVLKRVLEKVRFPENVKRIEVGVDEGEGQGAWTGKDF
jgi:6-pyruvoyltetrahydropterin/6-carboxytetrahydropterin synthase